jgi:Zn-finger nucleic acid-binding protein
MSKMAEDISRNIAQFDQQLHQHVSYEDDVVHQTNSIQTKKKSFFN